MWLEEAVLNAQRKTYKAQSVVFGKPNLRKGSTQKDYGTPLWLLPKISSRECETENFPRENSSFKMMHFKCRPAKFVSLCKTSKK